MNRFRAAGKTIVFVSHSSKQVREVCDRAVWVHEGKIVQEGASAEVTEAYHDWSVNGGELPAVKEGARS
jgi:teichoic acid transport system ATP-binding protein